MYFDSNVLTNKTLIDPVNYKGAYTSYVTEKSAFRSVAKIIYRVVIFTGKETLLIRMVNK